MLLTNHQSLRHTSLRNPARPKQGLKFRLSYPPLSEVGPDLTCYDSPLLIGPLTPQTHTGSLNKAEHMLVFTCIVIKWIPENITFQSLSWICDMSENHMCLYVNSLHEFTHFFKKRSEMNKARTPTTCHFSTIQNQPLASQSRCSYDSKVSSFCDRSRLLNFVYQPR